MEVTVESHPNIALVKYWGKADAATNTPINGSVSIGMQNVKTTTNVHLEPAAAPSIEMELNGMPVTPSQRVQNMIDYLISLSPPAAELLSTHSLKITSSNSFPTGAGMASSASGMAALAVALKTLLAPTLSNQTTATLARLGSGSACRSIHPGFVRWDAENGIVTQVATDKHWPELRLLAVVCCAEKKAVGSTEGMLRSAATCPFMDRRAEVASARLEDVESAIISKDFPKLAEEVMRDSNDLHAVCLSSYPPIVYLSASSLAVINTVHALNSSHNSPIAAYTFDAGPNAMILTTAAYCKQVKWALSELKLAGSVKDIIDIGVGGGTVVQPMKE
ncbi:Diphosphomevalonate/phosphomevalonate decarboxylase [Carpediemonas membranifera]|uniref:Diphosphomevalonate decarboxylase n=1 Tax=Carpediemonas membranifera TaxID=201153 RepID=A0A8J6E8M5_9EUKA|nr:Diphosphomevalonate/phosphomevalonate decarboxylase [Carpediemonas membranifera]|eukprot:KAG9392125.1 Diphosphomevalonate/phosphomevalonate decarboxylase [Carpediemonas membranifera]